MKHLLVCLIAFSLVALNGCKEPKEELKIVKKTEGKPSGATGPPSTTTGTPADKNLTKVEKLDPIDVPNAPPSGPAHDKADLAIGKMAPDITGPDFDGKVFKLSDYRGKIVVIDFWGDW